MPKIYKVKYKARVAEMFEEVDPGCGKETWWVFEPRDRYYEIIEEREVSVKLEFASSYRGELAYTFFDKNYTEYRAEGEIRRITLRIRREEWQDGLWNYTPEEFEAQVNGALMIPHLMCGEALPPEIFAIIKLMHPEVIRGHYDHEKKCWVKDG